MSKHFAIRIRNYQEYVLKGFKRINLTQSQLYLLSGLTFQLCIFTELHVQLYSRATRCREGAGLSETWHVSPEGVCSAADNR